MSGGVDGQTDSSWEAWPLSAGHWTLPGRLEGTYRWGMAGDDPDVDPPSGASGPGTAETLGENGVNALSEDDRAGAGMEIGRMLNEIDQQDESDPLPNHVDVPRDVSPEFASQYTRMVYENQADRSERRSHHRAYLIAILAILGGAAIAGALLFTSLAGEESTPGDGGVAAPAALPAPAIDAAPVPDTDAAWPTPTKSSEEPRPTPESTTTTDCLLPVSTVQVAIVNDRQEPSEVMSGLVLQVWDVNFTNDTAEAVVVGAHYTSTRDDKVISEAWSKRRVSPGRTEHESGSRDLTVNGKKAEQASLIFDRMLVVENRDACVPLLDDPQVQAQAVALPVPPSP